MSEINPDKNPLERVEVPVTDNCTLKASRFCLEKCGLYGEAQHIAVLNTVIETQEPASASWSEDDINPPVIETEGTDPPQTVLSCKGPRKEFLIFGELTCRESAKIDAEHK